MANANIITLVNRLFIELLTIGESFSYNSRVKKSLRIHHEKRFHSTNNAEITVMLRNCLNSVNCVLIIFYGVIYGIYLS